MIHSLINTTIQNDLVMIEVNGVYQIKYKNELDSKDRVISKMEIQNNREAVRELLSIVTYLYFDDAIE